MIVTYQPEDILKDVEKYLDGGMDNLGFVPAYVFQTADYMACLLYTSPSPRDLSTSRMPSSA